MKGALYRCFWEHNRTLQRIPVKLTHSQHVESSCGILHEKVSE